MRAVVWSEAALADFVDAIARIARDDRQAASLVADRIEAAIAVLADRSIGRPGRLRGTFEKRVLATPYIIAYSVSGQTLTVLRIIHERRDWPPGRWPRR